MSRRLLLLTIALLMFPQLAQTLYSPALADLAERFALPPSAASQAMSLYLFGFAAGVLLWGRLADRIGRRPALLCGLAVFALAACGAAKQFDETEGWSPARLYEEAKAEIDVGNYERGIELLEKLEARYPYGRFAQQAQIDTAFAYYKAGDNAQALAGTVHHTGFQRRMAAGHARHVMQRKRPIWHDRAILWVGHHRRRARAIFFGGLKQQHDPAGLWPLPCQQAAKTKQDRHMAIMPAEMPLTRNG